VFKRTLRIEVKTIDNIKICGQLLRKITASHIW